MALTVRERIMRYFETGFKSVQAGVDGYEWAWDVVTRKPIDPRKLTSNETVVGIYDGREPKTQQTQATRCALNITIEFFFKIRQGDEAPSMANAILGEVQRLVLSDINAGGLALDIQVKSTELDFESFSDSFGAGMVTLVVDYRHKVNNPFKLLGEP